MKTVEYTKESTNKIYKFFNLPLYTLSYNYSTGERTQKFLGGLITTKKNDCTLIKDSEKNIKFLGINLLKRIEDKEARTYYFINIPLKKISLEKIFKDKFIKYFDKKYDDIYLLNANGGEIYLFLTYVIDAVLKKNNSKSPLIVTNREYHKDLVKIICPEIPCLVIKNFRCNIQKKSFKIDNFNFTVVFPHTYFQQVEFDIKNNPDTAHYFKSILKYFNVSNDELSYRKIQIPKQDEESALSKAKKENLNLDNFIFLAPEAQSCELIEEKFWIDLIKDYQSKGFDIFVNLKDNMVKLENISFKTFPLTFPEAFALAKKAKKIITLRSGINELLLQTGVEMEVYYTNFRHRETFGMINAQKVINGFKLKEIPNTDKAHEHLIKTDSKYGA